MQVQGKSVEWEMRFSYPEAGPADVYALGVPRSARLVDRVPSGDVKRILQTIQAGRVRMDHYRAVVVEQNGNANSEWWNNVPIVLYRKGDHFARILSGPGREWLPATPPRSGEDPGTWWAKRVGSCDFEPHCMMRGVTDYTPEFKYVTDRKHTSHVEIVSVTTFETNLPPKIIESGLCETSRIRLPSASRHRGV